jgi:cation diffusion facilitator CzcD-associated flavoprotein CzcO
VAIIGAGVGGIGAAIALKRVGIEEFVVLECASDMGRTWSRLLGDGAEGTRVTRAVSGST